MIHMTKGYQVHAAHNLSNHPSQATTRAAQTTSLELQNTSDNIELKRLKQYSTVVQVIFKTIKCVSVLVYT